MPLARWVPAGVLAVAALAAGCEAGPEGVLVVYTPLDAPLVEAVEDGFEAAHPDVDVRMVALSGGHTLERLRAEKGGSQADVWWGATPRDLEAAAAEGLLEASSPSWAGSETGVASEAGAKWHTVAVSPFVFAFNVEETARSRMPRDWRDLFHPRWAGGVLLPDPLVHSATALLLGAWIVREEERTGDERAGFDWLLRLDRVAGDYAPDVDGVITRLRSGAGSVGILPLVEVTKARKDGRTWLEHTMPESGSPVVTMGAALLAGREPGPQAGAFLEYLGGPEARAASEEAGWLTRPVGLTIWPVDHARLAADLDGWLERWRLEVRGLGGGLP